MARTHGGAAGAIFLCIVRRIRGSSIPWPDYGTRGRFTYEATSEDASEIASLRQRMVAGRLNELTLPGSCFLFRCGSIFGVRIDRTNHPPGEYGRSVRMPKRTRLEDDRVLSDFRQFRTVVESFSQFLAIGDVVIHGPGHFRICTLKEAVLLMTDLFLLASGRISTDRAIESVRMNLIKGHSWSNFRPDSRHKWSG